MKPALAVFVVLILLVAHGPVVSLHAGVAIILIKECSDYFRWKGIMWYLFSARATAILPTCAKNAPPPAVMVACMDRNSQACAVCDGIQFTYCLGSCSEVHISAMVNGELVDFNQIRLMSTHCSNLRVPHSQLL